MAGKLIVQQLSQVSRSPRPQNCKGCPYKSRTCGPKGPIDSPFVIVGESSGDKDIMKNLPFVGPSWLVLQEAFRNNIEPYYTNAICCKPKNKDSGNLNEAAHVCKAR